MQTYSNSKPQFWKKKDDPFDRVVDAREKHLMVESWLRQLPDNHDTPTPDISSISVHDESSIEILRKSRNLSNSTGLERKPSSSSIVGLIEADYQATKRKYKTGKSHHPRSYKTARKAPKSATPVPSVPTLTSTQITESATNTGPTGTLVTDIEETENSESSYTYAWLTVSKTKSSRSKTNTDTRISQLKKLHHTDSTPSVRLKTVKKKVLNSTAKINAKSLECVDFTQNISPIVNSDIQYDALRQQQFEESTPCKSTQSCLQRDIYPNQKTLQKKAKKALSSTAIHHSGVNIEDRFDGISSINIDATSDKTLKQKRSLDSPVISVDKVTMHKKVKALTSTPTSEAIANHLPSLNIDLSSVGSASLCADELVPLRKSDDEVNSEEILAETFIDIGVEIPDIQDISIESIKENPPENDEQPKTFVPIRSGQQVSGKSKKNYQNTVSKCKTSKKKKKNNNSKSLSRVKTTKSKRCPKKSKNIVHQSSLFDDKASLIVCPLSRVPVKTKCTSLVYIRPANKEFWDMVRKFPIDPLTTVKVPKPKK